MKTGICVLLSLTILLAVPASAENTAATSKQINDLTTMCSKTADARTARQADKSLYERLGGYDKIEQFITELVHNHSTNPDFQEMMKSIDQERLVKHVTDFVAAGTGGTAKYTGRTLEDSHAPLHFDDADFLSAGGDIVKAMNTMEYGQEEIDEFMCILMSMKDQVVFE